MKSFCISLVYIGEEGRWQSPGEITGIIVKLFVFIYLFLFYVYSFSDLHIALYSSVGAYYVYVNSVNIMMEVDKLFLYDK